MSGGGFFRHPDPSLDAVEQQMRNMQAPPAVAPRPEQIPAEIVYRRMEAASREQAQTAQAAKSALIGDEAVRCLALLLEAVGDQRDGRPLDTAVVHQAVGDLARIFAVAQARGLGLSSGVTFGAA